MNIIIITNLQGNITDVVLFILYLGYFYIKPAVEQEPEIWIRYEICTKHEYPGWILVSTGVRLAILHYRVFFRSAFL
jgi:hypothetical protein